MAPVEMKAQEEFEKKEVPFFNLFDLHFQREDSVIGFYNLYRDLVFSGISKSLMDYQKDILSRVPAFLRGIDDGLPAISKNEVDQPARYGTINKELKHRVPVADQGFFFIYNVPLQYLTRSVHHNETTSQAQQFY